MGDAARLSRSAALWALSLSGLAGCSESLVPSEPSQGTALPSPGLSELATRPPTLPQARANRPPPPIIGGTLLITQDSRVALAADPDVDTVYLVELDEAVVRARVRLPEGSEPGRSIEDRDGNLHVVLRGSGQVVKLSRQSGAIEALRPVCPAPRGLAYDATTDNLHIACAGGELWTLKARSGETLRTWRLDSDLRDVAIKGSHLLVSRFRSAELIEVDELGRIVGRVGPRSSLSATLKDPSGKLVTHSPTTAWRMAPLPDGRVVMLHQRARDNPLTSLLAGSLYYGPGRRGTCDGSELVSPGLTVFSGASAGGVGGGGSIPWHVLAVDVAVSRDGTELATISPLPALAQASITPNPILQIPLSRLTPAEPCVQATGAPHVMIGSCKGLWGPLPCKEEGAIAGAYDGQKRLWIQARSPAVVTTEGGPRIELEENEAVAHEGHRLFHFVTDLSLLACASCHPEGGDDGHVWNFDLIGARRTQNLRGGLLATAPFHWNGDLANMQSLLGEVFVRRMGGWLENDSQSIAMAQWLDGLKVPPRSPGDAPAIARGKALFEDPVVGCTSCHSGPHLTNNQSVEVGTGAAFQVPSLIGLAHRAPFMHDGCATTLRGRFAPACGGGDRHGKTSQLLASQIDDLVAYLESL